MSDLLNLFIIIDLTPGGRPLLKENEVEIKWIDDINIQSENKEDIFPSKIITIILTNINIIILLPLHVHRVCAWSLPLKDVQSIEDCSTTFKISKRIKINMKDNRKILLKFLNGHKESTIELINKSLQRKSWEQQSTQSIQLTKVEDTQFSVKSAGISGLIRRQEREHQSIDAVRREALTDLDALMNRAKDVVAVIDRYAHGRFDKPDDQSDTSSEMGDASILEGILLNIGNTKTKQNIIYIFLFIFLFLDIY